MGELNIDGSPRGSVLVVDSQVPTYDQDSGSLRMFSILRLLTELRYRVTFHPFDGQLKEPYTGELKKLGVDVQAGGIYDLLTARGSEFDAAILSRPEVADRVLFLVRSLALNSKVIYDTVDIHWVRFQRAAGLYASTGMQARADHYRGVEAVNALCSDLTLTVTEDDRQHLLKEARGAKVEILPNIHQPQPLSNSFVNRSDLLFIGGFYHKPNVDAVLFFAKEIFPLIKRQLPGIKFYVVGSNPPEELKKLQGPDIKVTGYVKEVIKYFEQCRVFVAPLRYGAGMKGKVGQSMAYGLPVVATPVGAEGMGLTDGKNILVAESPGDFAFAAVRLYLDEALWRRVSEESVVHIRKNFSPEVVKDRLEKIMSGLLEKKKPQAAAVHQAGETKPRKSGGSALVLGIYLANKENNIGHIVDELDKSRDWKVTQKWAALGGMPQPDHVQGVTVLKTDHTLPKYVMLNNLLAQVQTDGYDYIIFCDDDISLPAGFLDRFLGLQQKYDFALAQPARTHNSYVDFTINEMIDGISARQTRIVEQGPLFSFRQEALRLVLPFEARVSPMGWGYEFAWAYRLEKEGFKLGIIDATPVDHSMRRPVANYFYQAAKEQMDRYLASTPHLSLEEAFTVVRSFV